MSTEFIGRTSAPQAKDSTFTQTLDIRNSVLIALESHTSSKIIIASTDDHAYEDAKVACQFKVKFHLNNVTTTTSTKTQFEKALFVFEQAQSYSECKSAEEYMLGIMLETVPYTLRENQAIELIRQASNNKYKQDIVNTFKTALKAEKDTIRATISISKDNKDVIFVDKKYGPELVQHIANTPGIHAIIGKVNAGKTSKVLMPAFEHFCEQGNTPILVNSSRALAASQLPWNDKRFYIKALKSRKMPTGLLGVINTVLMTDDFAKERKASDVFMVDEIEEVLNHMTGAAVGEGTLEDMKLVRSRFDEQVRKSKTVIIADAFTSDFTISDLAELAKESGKQIFVYDQEGTREKPVVRVMSEEMNISKGIQALETKKVPFFSDAKHNQMESKVNALIEAIKPAIKGKYSLIDSHFMQDDTTSKLLSNADKFASSMDAIFYNSAAKCGLSVQNGEYQQVHVFSHQTVAPNELIQAPGRFRDAKTVNLSFDKSYRRLLPQTAWAVLGDMMAKDYTPEQFTQEAQNELFDDPIVRKILARIEYKNKMKKNYKNKVLIMLEVLGYEIQFIENEAKQVEVGKNAKKYGSETEKDLRYKGITKARKIDDVEYHKAIEGGTYNSQAVKNELENYALRKFYKQLKVTEELLDFDNIGQGRKAIANMKIARGDVQACTARNVNSIVKTTMIDKFFQLTNLSPVNFGQYTKVEAEKFQHYLEADVIQVEEQTFTAKQAFTIAFPTAKINARAMSTVSSILKCSFALINPEKVDIVGTKSARIAVYKASANPEAELYYNTIIEAERKLAKVDADTTNTADKIKAENQVTETNIEHTKEIQFELDAIEIIEGIVKLPEVA